MRLRALPYTLADRLASMQAPAEIATLLLNEIDGAVGASAPANQRKLPFHSSRE